MQKATGITKPTKDGIWEELWVGDKITCFIWEHSISGNHIYMEGEIIWNSDYAQYSIKGEYENDSAKYKAIFPIHQIVNRDITFIKKVKRLEPANNIDSIMKIIEDEYAKANEVMMGIKDVCSNSFSFHSGKAVGLFELLKTLKEKNL